jgi:gluconokinase
MDKDLVRLKSLIEEVSQWSSLPASGRAFFSSRARRRKSLSGLPTQRTMRDMSYAIDSETKLPQAIGEILQRERTKEIQAYLFDLGRRCTPHTMNPWFLVYLTHYYTRQAMILVLMGVSGSGKTTIGRALANELGWSFIEGDEFHPASNVEKMHRGEPLDDEDRRPWLRALRQRIDEACAQGENAVLACSALKHDYREYLERDEPACVRYVYLCGSEELIRRRLAQRKGHFMNPGLLHSQFETLEPPDDAIRVDVAPALEAIVAEIRRQLGL